ncbi:PEP-CTERM sorting domain-containing protein [Cerasicoccus maritimus]|uniref:PEP-CTERM sorting domain-containing protein n=1 Tax=Cerasicoccus maritimus TaxID=490089 RepID=UPI0028526115|nr:PEP-CTERM sorting domain-containing protein [Cerasicoccus maritimus]
MKTYISILSLLAFGASQSHGVLLAYEPFDDIAGTTVPSNMPILAGSSSTDAVTSGSLTSPSGLEPSQDNKFSLTAGGNVTYGLSFTPTGSSTGDTVYYSFLFELTDLSSLATSSTNGPILTLSTGTTKQVGAFSVALDADNSSAFNIGFDASNKGIGGGAVVDTTEYLANTTYFIVVAYTPEGGLSGSGSLWVNPDSSSFGTETAPTVTLSDAGGYAADIATLLLDKQYSATPGFNVDEIRVGTSWADVTPATVPEPGHYAMLLGTATLGLLYIRRRK